MKAIAAFLIAAAAFLAGTLPAAAQQFPALTGRVTDAADIVPADVEARLQTLTPATYVGIAPDLVDHLA
mgnify:CR=1 FL=1